MITSRNPVYSCFHGNCFTWHKLMAQSTSESFAPRHSINNYTKINNCKPLCNRKSAKRKDAERQPEYWNSIEMGCHLQLLHLLKNKHSASSQAKGWKVPAPPVLKWYMSMHKQAGRRINNQLKLYWAGSSHSTLRLSWRGSWVLIFSLCIISLCSF